MVNGHFNMKYTVLIYTKIIKTNDGKNFPKYLLRLGKKVMDCNIETKTRKLLEGEALQKGIKMPFKVTIDDTQYFIKTRKYTNKVGEIVEQDTIALLGYTSLEKGEFPKGKTLGEVAGE